MKKKIRTAKHLSKLLILGSLPLFLVSFGLADEQFSAEKTTENLPAKPLSKEEFTAALAGKFQLMKIRTNQLKKINTCFLRASDLVLQAEKKGEHISKAKAKELIEAQGLSEASKLDLPVDLTSNNYIGNKAQRLIELAQNNEDKKIDAEFIRLENELRADIELAKGMGIDLSPYKNDMSDYARSRIESVMWLSIFMKK